MTLAKLISALERVLKPRQVKAMRILVKALLAEIRRLRSEKQELRRKNHDLVKLIEEQKRRGLELKSRMRINPSSGLPNKQRMETELAKYIDEGSIRSKGNCGAIFLIKLDKSYGSIQRTIKPQMSEWVLFQIAERLRSMFKGKKLYHVKEDEFLLLLEGDHAVSGFEKIARALEREISQPHVFTGYNVHINCCIAITLFPNHGYQKTYLLQNAEIALEYALDRGQSYALYNEKMREQILERMELQNSIVRALELQAIRDIDRQFHLYYQPILELRIVDGEFQILKHYAEALIRWRHPRMGSLSPKTFIPLAEETGLIIPMGNWVVFSVAKQLEIWHRQALPIEGVSVNVSARQFHSDEFVGNVTRAISQHNFPAKLLRIEITETSLIDDPRRAIGLMNKLHKAGITFSIDDFGTGYSSLSYVHRLPVSHLKIDQSFVKNMARDRKSRAIIRTIIAMAKELGFNPIAEGVEDEEQLEFLYAEGVRIFQGFLFHAPVPAADYEAFVRNMLPEAPISGGTHGFLGPQIDPPANGKADPGSFLLRARAKRELEPRELSEI